MNLNERNWSSIQPKQPVINQSEIGGPDIFLDFSLVDAEHSRRQDLSNGRHAEYSSPFPSWRLLPFHHAFERASLAGNEIDSNGDPLRRYPRIRTLSV